MYRVDSDIFEPPRGSFFTTVPKFNLETGDFVLLKLAGILFPGRWHPKNGSIRILIPGYRIEVDGNVEVIVVGLIVPLMTRPCWN